jgi:tRNA (cytidine/uridine-2'-O-)-methyltransferase
LSRTAQVLERIQQTLSSDHPIRICRIKRQDGLFPIAPASADLHGPHPTALRSVNIVLVEPEIPPNTGNIARLCAATGSTLHLIEPLGFEIDDKRLARAGMDYWKLVTWKRWSTWNEFQTHLATGSRLWFVEQGAPRRYTQAEFAPDDYLVFGRETAGLPLALLQAHSEQWLDIPMANPEARSLNLSNCVAIVLFEALRQISNR